MTVFVNRKQKVFIITFVSFVISLAIFFSGILNIFEGSIDDVFKTLVVNVYSKSQEYKADEGAITYLSRAGYYARSLKDFLDRMYTQEQTSGGGILQTHPATMNRIKNITKELPAEEVNTVSFEKRTHRFDSFCH